MVLLLQPLKNSLAINYLFFCCYISSSRGKAIDRIPLPPPMYGAASFSSRKPSHSSSFGLGAPSSAGQNTVRGLAPAPPPTSYASDNHVMHSFYSLN